MKARPCYVGLLVLVLHLLTDGSSTGNKCRSFRRKSSWSREPGFCPLLLIVGLREGMVLKVQYYTGDVRVVAESQRLQDLDEGRLFRS